MRSPWAFYPWDINTSYVEKQRDFQRLQQEWYEGSNGSKANIALQLSRCYLEPFGTNFDLERAAFYLNSAAQTDTEARLMLDALEEKIPEFRRSGSIIESSASVTVKRLLADKLEKTFIQRARNFVALNLLCLLSGNVEVDGKSIRVGDEDAFCKLIRDGVGNGKEIERLVLTYRDIDGREIVSTMLEFCAMMGLHKVIETAIREIPVHSVLEQIPSWCRILVAACKYGQASTVRYLIRESLLSQYGNTSTFFSREDVSPLHFLAIFQDDDIPGIAQALAGWGAPLDHTYMPSEGEEESSVYLMRVGGTPLHAAIRSGCLEAVLALLQHGANPVIRCNSLGTEGLSAARLAASLCQPQMVECFIFNIQKPEDVESTVEELIRGLFVFEEGGRGKFDLLLLHGTPAGVEMAMTATIRMLLAAVRTDELHGFEKVVLERAIVNTRFSQIRTPKDRDSAHILIKVLHDEIPRLLRSIHSFVRQILQTEMQIEGDVIGQLDLGMYDMPLEEAVTYYLYDLYNALLTWLTNITEESSTFDQVEKRWKNISDIFSRINHDYGVSLPSHSLPSGIVGLRGIPSPDYLFPIDINRYPQTPLNLQCQPQFRGRVQRRMELEENISKLISAKGWDENVALERKSLDVSRRIDLVVFSKEPPKPYEDFGSMAFAPVVRSDGKTVSNLKVINRDRSLKIKPAAQSRKLKVTNADFEDSSQHLLQEETVSSSSAPVLGRSTTDPITLGSSIVHSNPDLTVSSTLGVLTGAASTPNLPTESTASPEATPDPNEPSVDAFVNYFTPQFTRAYNAVYGVTSPSWTPSPSITKSSEKSFPFIQRLRAHTGGYRQRRKSTPVIKLVLVGDDAAGKTTLISSYVENFFPNASIGRVYEGHGLDVSINEKPYVISLTDTAGQEELDRVRVTNYVGAHAFIVVYRLMDDRTWNNVVEKWIPEVKHEQPNVPIVICGLDDDTETAVEAFSGSSSPDPERSSIESIVSLGTAVATTVPPVSRKSPSEKKKARENLIEKGQTYSKQVGASYMFCTMDKKDPDHSTQVKEVFDEAATVGFKGKASPLKIAGRFARGRRLSWLR